MGLLMLPTLLFLLAGAPAGTPQSNQAYVGSDACRPCHGPVSPALRADLLPR